MLGARTDLGDSLGFVGLLRCVLRNTLSLDAFGLRVILLVTSEEIDIVVVVCSGRGGRSTTEECIPRAARAGERSKLGGVRLDMGVPPGDVGIRRRAGRR